MLSKLGKQLVSGYIFNNNQIIKYNNYGLIIRTFNYEPFDKQFIDHYETMRLIDSQGIIVDETCFKGR